LVRWITLIILSVLLVFSFSAVSSANEKITIMLNGEPIYFDQEPVVVDGTTLVPLRAIFEKYNMTVDFSNETKTISAKGSNKNISLVLGSKTAHVNGQPMSLNIAPRIIGGRTMVPLRSISELLGVTVDWDANTHTVYLKTKAGNGNDINKLAIYNKINNKTGIPNTTPPNQQQWHQPNNNVSDNISVSDIEDTLNDYFINAGDDYFGDDGIDIKVSMSGNEDKLTYTITIDFSDADYYTNLTKVSTTKIKTFLNAVKSKIYSKIDDTDYENAVITGKLIDNDHSSYYVKYNGSSYTYSWVN